MIFKAIKAALFGAKPESPPLREDPKIGEKWILGKMTDDPWERRYPPVVILDVRDGWVRYSLFDSRCSIRQFMSMYDKCVD